MTEREKEFAELLALVIRTAAEERNAQRALDEAEMEYVMNQSRDEQVHAQLREAVVSAKRTLKSRRFVAETTAAGAQLVLDPHNKAAA